MQSYNYLGFFYSYKHKMRCTDSNIHLGMEVLNRRWKTLQIQFFCKITANINFNFTFILILFGSLIQTGHGWTDYTPWSIPFRQIEMDKCQKCIQPTMGSRPILANIMEIQLWDRMKSG